MPLKSPQWNYFISPDNTPIQRDHPKWTTPVPLNRHQAEQPSDITESASFNYGDYFIAARDFLQQNRLEMLTGALSRQLNQNIKREDIEAISIGIEKHGEFYHAARIDVALPNTTTSLVLNVAVSENGKNFIRKEFEVLNKLQTSFLFSFVPKVYDQGQVVTTDNLECNMFLGEWFEGFNEFHISLDPQDKKYKIIVWDTESGPFFLTSDQTLALYQQAAMILTSYYNVETLEQIFPWHHAAGDFVVKLVNNRLNVKLVTARNYVSLFKTNEVDDQNRDIQALLDALLVFFLNLTIRMRLDRQDGIGEIVWADDIAIYGTLQGFFEGLALKPPLEGLPDTLINCFRAYLLSLSQKDMTDLCFAITKSYNPKAPEVFVIKRNLEKHAKSLYETMIDNTRDE